jgi:energy-coupling factor transport system ATP-binding protein
VTEHALARNWPGDLPLSVPEAATRLRADPALARPALADALGAPPACPEAGAPPALEVSGLSFAYDPARPVLRDVSLRVPAGEFAVLVGANGSGKSTLAALAVGLRPPPRGAVSLFDSDVRDLTTAESAERAGYVFQNPEHQFVEDTVFDELAYSLRARRRPTDEVAATVRGLLADLAQANPFTLSQGQKRRLSVATMLAVGQRLLILDEPTFGQDRRGSARLMGLLGDLNRAGVTLLMITHDMRLVAEWARVAHVLAEGRVIFSGPPAELFARPDVMRAARLLPPPLVELAGLT